MSTKRCLVLATMVLMMAPGCASNRLPNASISRTQLRQRAMDCLKAGIGYSFNAAVRAEAVEALESSLSAPSTMPWIRAALRDDHPAVRFAACVAVGRLRDVASEMTLRELVNDSHGSVRVAALFALHRLGHSERTSLMPAFLLAHADAAVRRNAALVLGLMEEPSAVKVLARAMKDQEAGVRQHALEAMARLGVREAKQELGFMTNAGIGSQETFAIQALSAARDRAYLDVFRGKLATGSHVETRLAAARALGRLGSDEGFEFALSTLRTYKPRRGDADDPPEQKALRVRQLAVAALGAIGNDEAQPELAGLLEQTDDPRVQVAAAKAILDILEASRRDAFPLTAAVGPSRP